MLRRLTLFGWLTAMVPLALSPSAVEADLVVLTDPADPLVALYDTTAGGDGTVANPDKTGVAYGLAPQMAISRSITDKYLNFGNGPEGESSATKGVGAGFYVTTAALGPTVLKSFQMTTAEDFPSRDPMTITIEGSNASGSDLLLGRNWSLLYTGSTGWTADPGRRAAGESVAVAGSDSYTSYRVLITSHRDVANCTQFSEISLDGYAIPEPTTGLMLIGGALGCLTYAWWNRKQR